MSANPDAANPDPAIVEAAQDAMKDIPPDAPLEGITPSHIREVLVQAGCRAEITPAPDGLEMVSSALHGTGFTVRFVNAYEPNTRVDASSAAVGFSDISFVYLPRIDGLPPGGMLPGWLESMVSEWNSSRRFAHVAILSQDDARYLVLRWDVLVIGVTYEYLHACVRLWDQLMQEFFLFLRHHAAQGAGVGSADEPGHAGDAKV